MGWLGEEEDAARSVAAAPAEVPGTGENLVSVWPGGRAASGSRDGGGDTAELAPLPIWFLEPLEAAQMAVGAALLLLLLEALYYQRTVSMDTTVAVAAAAKAAGEEEA